MTTGIAFGSGMALTAFGLGYTHCIQRTDDTVTLSALNQPKVVAQAIDILRKKTTMVNNVLYSVPSEKSNQIMPLVGWFNGKLISERNSPIVALVQFDRADVAFALSSRESRKHNPLYKETSNIAVGSHGKYFSQCSHPICHI
jgi:hypothetical protein